ncbi:MAG: hypothetical protein Q8867_06520 [Bacteroidota bacterium]|nr:hypothetical protein [Bacteroidota bacterium]
MHFERRTVSFILFFVFWGLTTRLFAQVSPGDNDMPLRVEIPTSSDQGTYRVIPMGANGLVLFFKSNEKVGDSLVKWYFAFYNHNLKQQWIKSINIQADLDYRKGSVSDTLCLGFFYSGKEKETDHTFMIIRLIPATASFLGNIGLIREGAELAGFEFKEDKVFIAYNLKNMSSRVLIMNLARGTAVNRILTPDTISSISTFQVDSLGRRFLIALRKMVKKNSWEIFLHSLSYEGDQMPGTLISAINPEIEIQSLRFCPQDEKNIYLFGTYGIRSSGKKNLPPPSTGFFLSKIQDHQQKDIHFLNFLELKNAANLLGDRDVISLKKKSIKKKRDINSYSLDFNIFLHPVISKKDQFLLMAETYNPQYHSENFTDFDFYGRPFTNTYSVFDGYRFTNAILACFNKDGVLQWDNTMEIRNLLTSELVPRVQIRQSGENLVLSYLSEGKIASKVVNCDKVIEKLDFSPLDLMFSEDKLLEETKSLMVPWYGNYYLCYGYQIIKNINRSEGAKRLVFYFTKVQFQ